MQIKRIHLELFLYFMLSEVYLNFIGNISIGEIWVLIATPFIIINKSIFDQYPILKKISFIYLLYLFSQIISELILGNEINNILRGLANTVVSYCTMIYLFDRLKRNYYLIALVFLYITIRSIYFINTAGLGEDSVVLDVTSSSFFKFKIVPVITSFIMFLSFFLLKKKKKILTIIMIFVTGLFYVLVSARSAAMGLFFVGIIFLFSEVILKNKRLLLPIVILLLSVSYGLYATWVSSQLNDELIIKNEQIVQMENPYNPFEMLKLGRTEFFVGALAFSDELLLGHGAWALDKTDKYSNLHLQLKGTSDRLVESESYGLIPSHSIILGAGVANGIFAFIAILWLIYYFLKLNVSIFPFMIKTPWAAIYLFQIISLSWAALFSPITHLRIEIPLIFACSIIFYSTQEQFRSFELNNTIHKPQL